VSQSEPVGLFKNLDSKVDSDFLNSAHFVFCSVFRSDSSDPNALVFHEKPVGTNVAPTAMDRLRNQNIHAFSRILPCSSTEDRKTLILCGFKTCRLQQPFQHCCSLSFECADFFLVFEPFLNLFPWNDVTFRSARAGLLYVAVFFADISNCNS